MDPIFDDKRSGMAKLMSLFSTAALSQDPNRWINLARSLAVQLRSPSLDWRDLARALEQVRTTAAGPEASGLFDRCGSRHAPVRFCWAAEGVGGNA